MGKPMGFPAIKFMTMRKQSTTRGMRQAPGKKIPGKDRPNE